MCVNPDTRHGEVEGTGDMPVTIHAIDPITYNDVYPECVLHDVAWIPDAREIIFQQEAFTRIRGSCTRCF